MDITKISYLLPLHKRTWATAAGGVYGHRTANTPEGQWNGECMAACRRLRIPSHWHKGLAKSSYYAWPVKLHGPLGILGDRAVFWISRFHEEEYAGVAMMMIAGENYGLLAEPSWRVLDSVDLANAVRASLVGTAGAVHDAAEYVAAYRKAGDEMYQQWVKAMAGKIAQFIRLAESLA